ncbi:uncharacterized protein LOC142775005 isoform X2 [Rhipicephalus microplus]|uniref:uncharacterized protein LOC142775005 isoform X2 n=1 Tax=Rhipicephalus microplus TaxID=6941 RepID=UPI003F6B9494
MNPHHYLEHLYKNRKDTFSLTVQAYVTAGTVIIQRMWRGSMHGSLIWKDCNLLGSFEGTKLPNGWLQACFSSRAMQLAHTQSKSWSALLVFCAGRSISIRQHTGINNNEVTRGSVLHGHEQCIKNRAQKTNKYKGTASDCSPARSLQQQKGHIVMSGAAAA